MLHLSTQRLIRKLYELTSTGSLSWSEGQRGTSLLETEGYVVEVAASPPGLRLLRGDGRELETATPDDLAAVAWPGGDGTYATRVAEMAGRAQRLACGTEQAIATILSSLSAPPTDQAAEPVAVFGETTSFAKSEAGEPSAPRPKPSPPRMRAYGISAQSVQGVEQSMPASFERFTHSSPMPQPTLRPAASGPNIYKPWN